MCGIAAIFDPVGATVSDQVMEAMVTASEHRGPDDRGVYGAEGVGLGSSRLSILDTSQLGHMPMVEPDTGCRIAHNGEVYNFKELRQEIGAEEFFSGSDTEAVLRSYIKYGADCVKKFNGIFAFAIWDPRTRQLVCARDHLGVKPFFYATLNGKTIIASEMKSLFAAGVPRRPDYRSLRDYLIRGAYDHGENTFFEGVRQLPPGHRLIADDGGVRIERYWDLQQPDDWAADPDRKDEKAYGQAQERFLELATDSIRLQLRSDVPVALHVSGGLDSTLMLAILNKLNGGQENLKAFTYCYGEEKYDERPHVEALTNAVGWSAEYHQLNVADVPEMTEQALHFQEQPFPGVLTLARHNLVQGSHHHGAKVILEGQGGDEIGAGYQYVFGPHLKDLEAAGRTDLVEREINAFARRNGIERAAVERIVAGGNANAENPGWSADGTRFAKPDCLSGEFAAAGEGEDLNFPTPFDSNLLNIQYRDLFHTKLPRILRSVDRASMAYGREIRVPLLDYRMVEYAFSLPGPYKILDGEQRCFFRDALKSIFPTALADAPKRPVVDPQRDWLKGPLSDWAGDIFASDSFKSRGICDSGEVRREFETYCASESPANSVHIWQWLGVELWFRQWIDGATP